MKQFLIVLTTGFLYTQIYSQDATDSVKAVINNMFTAMKTGDTVLLRSCFAESMILQTITRTKEGKTTVLNEQAANFIAFVGKEKPGAADERIVFETVRTDGALAIAWTPYSFYYNGNFSHCGVNSFQLVRIDDVWKIQYLIDTRRRHGCL